MRAIHQVIYHILQYHSASGIEFFVTGWFIKLTNGARFPATRCSSQFKTSRHNLSPSWAICYKGHDLGSVIGKFERHSLHSSKLLGTTTACEWRFAISRLFSPEWFSRRCIGSWKLLNDPVTAVWTVHDVVAGLVFVPLSDMSIMSKFQTILFSIS